MLWPLNRDERSWISVWDKDQKNYESSATGEAARRYYSTKEYLYRGAPGVFSIPSLEYDNKFMDNFFNPTNIWPHYSNEELKNSIEKYTEFPIATDTKNQQPRLLVISTDVREGEAVTFDSYQKPDGSRSSEYGDYVRGGKREMRMRYDDGLMTEHIMASSSVPVHYNYTMVPENYSNKSGNGVREYWDGGILSNTPLRELIQSHEDYWKAKDPNAVPALKVYIVNLWPHKGNAPLDHDGVVNRLHDLNYQDKTPHEEKIAYLVRDYIDLAYKLIEKSKIPPDELTSLLNSVGQSRHRGGENRKYLELLQKVQIIDVVRLEQKADPNEISYKWCDYSINTITAMIKEGITDTLNELITRYGEDPRISLDKFIDTVSTEKENEFLTEKLGIILDDITPSNLLIESASGIKTLLD